ncbi:hypothetical protein Glove_255g21 [Diversispora epigaea]|uniref:Uncharacterized protein n=1 Tax=Diversispora epigaea TaxID=1348612 RepID=A0A397I7L5_9GLOM|nr:hypothetical protein Glove_255g21 [Diversispora epigaea]
MTSAIKYSIARSKMIIDIDNHITSSGNYYQFQKWLEELLELQYEEIFDISSQMQDTLDKELYNFLFEIVYLLSEEKLSITNIIDSLIASTKINITNMKQCPNCHQKNIENQKQICPKCKMQLPTLTKIQKEKVINIEDESINHLTISTMPLTFKSCNFNNNELIAMPTSRISFTQRPVDYGVNVPEIYIPDPININPNSIANVEKILLYIKIISGNKHALGICKIKLSWDSICNIYHQAMAKELVWPYVKIHPDPSVEGYFVWVKKQQDSIYQIKYEQIFVYL